MMRARLLFAAAATVVLSAQMRAQIGTADGVDALLRRDYARAAAILKPLAESVWERDHRAEFFMAVLYDGGLGVAPDPLRACALFVRASGDHNGPLGSAATELVRARQRTLGPEAFATCNRRASIGFDDHFEPVTFTLDQGHWITWDLDGATIAYRGVEKRLNQSLASGPIRSINGSVSRTSGSNRSLSSPNGSRAECSSCGPVKFRSGTAISMVFRDGSSGPVGASRRRSSPSHCADSSS